MAAATPAKKRPAIALKTGPMSGWLPAVIAFLCLAMLAMAALTLINVNADPEDPQASRVTSVSAQGFAGLRRILDADGHVTALNRMEDSGEVTRGDLEIITLESQSVPLFNLPQAGGGDSASDGEDDGAASSDSASAASSPSAPDPAAMSDGFSPYPEEATHILYKPLGHAILVVAPKWSAAPAPQHPRWAANPDLVDDAFIRAMLLELSPETRQTAPVDKEGNHVLPKVGPGQGVYDMDDGVVIYDRVPYAVTRALAAGDVTLKSLDGARTLRVGKIDRLQTISAPNLQPVLLGPNGEPVLSRVIVTGGRRQPLVPVYLLSDPDLLNNQILTDPQKVVSALSLLDSVAPPVKTPYSIVFNITFNGASFHHDLMHALSRPPYLAVPLSLLVLALGLMWAAFARFGPARQVPVEAPLGRGVRILADNAARLMAITLKEAKLGPAYAQLVRDRVLKDKGYVQAAPSQSPDDLAEQIGRRHNTTHSYLDLRDRAAKIMTVHQLIDVTRLLHDWKTEIQRAHI